MILKCVPGGMFITNCYIIGDEEKNEGILIDPGEQIDEVLEEIDTLGLKITKIVNTHTHIDHTAGVEEAKQRLGVPFYIHEKEQPVLDLMQEAVKRWPQFGDVKTPEVDEYIEEGDELKIGELDVSVLLVPGHTWGSICFVIEDNIISGDTLFAGSVGRVDLTGGTTMKELVGSIKSKLFKFPDSYNVFPGHGPATTLGIEKRSNPFLQSGIITF